MGFGFFSKQNSSLVQAGPKTASKGQLILLENKRDLTCSNCPLDKEMLRNPKMLPTGAEHPVYYILGEAPGAEEDERGEQFIGDSGSYLRGKIPSRFKKLIRWNNSVRCRPPRNREPAELELACCRHLQEEDIARTKPKIVIGFGGVPLKWVTGRTGISGWHGRMMPARVRGHSFWFFPMLHPSYILRVRNNKKKGEGWERIFQKELHAAFDFAENCPAPCVEEEKEIFSNIRLIASWKIEDVEAALAEVSQGSHALDIETRGLRPYAVGAKILSIAVGTYENTVVIPVRHREAKWTAEQLKHLDDVIQHYLLNSGRKWCHNAKMEQEWSNHFYGKETLFKTEWGDTMAQAHVLDERRGKALDDLTVLHFGFDLKACSNVDVKNLDDYPLLDVMRYNGGDTKYTHGLSVVQHQLLEEQHLVPVYEMTMRRCHTLVLTQAKGLVPNTPEILRLEEALIKEVASSSSDIVQLKDVKAWTARRQKQYKPTSNDDLRDLLLSLGYGEKMKRADNKYSTDEEVLEQLKHPLAKMTLDLRSAQKLLGTYITPYKPKGKWIYQDGLIHGEFNHLVTVTGRLASSDPNLQNLPKRKHQYIRSIVRAPDGYWIVAFDYGQIEARVMAMASNPPKFVEQLWSNFDLHMYWTERALALEPAWWDYLVEEFDLQKADDKTIKKAARNEIKNNWVFASFYGSTHDACAASLHLSSGTTQKMASEFWRDYAEAKQWQNTTRQVYLDKGYCETLFGRRRRWGKEKSMDGTPLSLNELMNSPIQGTAADLVLDAMDRVILAARELGRPQYIPVLNVHDDLTFYLPDETLERDVEFLGKTMCDCRYSFVNVPLLVEVSAGKDWGQLENVSLFNSQDNSSWMEWYNKKVA